MLLHDRPEAGEHLVDGLVELGLTGVAPGDLFVDVVELFFV